MHVFARVGNFAMGERGDKAQNNPMLTVDIQIRIQILKCLQVFNIAVGERGTKLEGINLKRDNQVDGF